MNKTPRKVTVYMGKPEGAPADPEVDSVVSPTDGFTIDFQEADGEEGFTTQANCLCALAEAAEAWLAGEPPQVIETILTGSHEGETGDDEADAGESWKRG